MNMGAKHAYHVCMAGDPADAKIDWHFKGNSLTLQTREYIQESTVQHSGD
jgi:hypothetical protein